MAALLDDAQVRQQLETLEGWSREGDAIACQRKFKGFVEAVDFVNRLVEPAEKAGHHPDLEISYNKVTIRLTTHDAGGLTQNDFDMARTIAAL